LTEVEFPIHASIETHGQPAEARAQASDCHKSQLAGGPPRSGVIGLITKLMGQRDQFMRAYPAVPSGEQVKETDLFVGVKS